MTQNYSYKTSRNDNLSVTVYGADKDVVKDCIIFVHGFKGFKDWGFGPYLAEYLANKGFFVVTFNFSHNGIDESNEFSDIEKFAQNTFSLEIEELEQIIAACKTGSFDNQRVGSIGLIGHSRGGGVAIITAASSDDVDSVITWSAVAKFDRYSERQKNEWRNKGVFEVLNARTKQVMKLNLTLLEDIENNRDKLDIIEAAGNLEKPLLIIHGEQDLAVPVSEAEELYANADKSVTEFLKIANTGHTFDIKHPFEGSNPKFEKVLDTTYRFFSKTLSKSESTSG